MPRTRSLAWSELKLGILAVVAVALAAFFIFLVGGQGGLPWQRYHLKSRFPNVAGLKEGAVVRLAGVEVGQVSSIEFAGSQVEVVYEVSKDIRDKITTQSRAMLGSVSLLGESAIDLTPGTGESVPEWGYVPTQRTPGQLADVAENATEGIQEVTQLLKEVRAGKGTIGKLFTDEQMYREFTALLTSADAVVANINRGRGTLGRLTNDPAACANCHVMSDQYAGWTKSSHRSVATCNDCHTPHSLVPKYVVKARNGFWHSFYFTSGRFPEPIQITPRNFKVTEQACRSCHEDIVLAIEGPHDENETACTQCHRNVGHLH